MRVSQAASRAATFSFALIALAAYAGSSRGSVGDNAESAAFFESKVRPVLLEHCTSCHGDRLQKGGLRLDSRAALIQGGAHGNVLVPGAPDKSLLVQAVRYTGTLKMPPTGPLPPSDIAALTTWVQNGAVWPENKAQIPAKSKIENRKSKIPTHWSFLPVRPPVPPKVKNDAWVHNPIDAFILAGLEAKGLTPSAPADRRTLIRRASFDLTGLPPTPDEVEAFVFDKSPNAWEKVVDRLLASPRYGERWGRHWLDVARYADSLDARGLGSEGDISEAWRYRDWVIDAFNRDMPYNQFIQNQIAGDLLPAPPDVQGHFPDFNVPGTIATGLLAIGNWGNGDADKDKILTDIADDQVDIVSRGFLGLTIGCARCHDHKFDPISTKDYYGLAGIFFSTHILPKLTPKGAGENILHIPLETKADRERRAQYAARTAELEKQQKSARDNACQNYAKSLIPETARYLTAVWEYQHRPAEQSDLTLAAFAKKRGLQTYALRQWRDFLGMGDAYRLMTQQVRNVAEHPGVFTWQQETGTPNLTVNTTDQALQILTFTLPPKSVNVHPGPTAGVTVEWVSPITGTVQVTGSVKDADPACGNGIAWVIAHRQRSGVTEIASGEFPNGGEQNFAKGKNAANLNTISVRPGDKIEMQVLPNGEYSCDTTTVDFVIKQTDGAQVWNLTADLLDDPLKANPRADRYGHADVWRLTDMANSGAKPYSGAVLAPALTKWRDAVAKSEAEKAETPDALQQKGRIEAAAKEFQQAFALTDKDSPFYLPSQQEESLLPAEARTELAKIETELDSLRKNPPPMLTYANGAQEGGVPESPHAGIHDVHVHIRGSYARLGDLVPRHFPVVLAGDNQPPITQGSGRLELARWIASDTNPLTARVMVNRIWQHHFGQGIVRTPSNFGLLGERPTNQALLDYLAAEFVKSGWCMKQMHRLIMLSATYRQSSLAPPNSLHLDADNRLFGRMNRLRLEAEELRDNLLSVSGTLDTTMGGVAYRDFNTTRRTVYLMTIRSDRSGFGPLFDLADSTATADHRTISNVAPQALFLMNNAFALQQANLLAKRLQSKANDDTTRIQTAYRLLYSRPPSAAETKIGLTFLNRMRGESRTASAANAETSAWENYCQILLCANEFMYVD